MVCVSRIMQNCAFYIVLGTLRLRVCCFVPQMMQNCGVQGGTQLFSVSRNRHNVCDIILFSKHNIIICGSKPFIVLYPEAPENVVRHTP